MSFTKIRQVVWVGRGVASKVGGQEVERGVDGVGQIGEYVTSRDGVAAENAGFESHHGLEEAARVGEDDLGRGEARRLHSRFDGEARDGGFQVRSSEAAGLPRPGETRGELRLGLEAGLQVGIAHSLEIFAVGIEECGQRLRNLCPLPGGPKTIGGEGDDAAGDGIQPRAVMRGPGGVPPRANRNTTRAVSGVTSNP